MRITSLRVQNFRSFESMEPIALNQINVLIGPNNAGKSSILRALYLLQMGCGDVDYDVRIDADEAQVVICLEEISGITPWGPSGNAGKGVLVIKKQRTLSPQLRLHSPHDENTFSSILQLPNR